MLMYFHVLRILGFFERSYLAADVWEHLESVDAVMLSASLQIGAHFID